MATLERGQRGDELRVSLDEFEPDDGAPAQYVSIRQWYDDRGTMKPGKGTTVRVRELQDVIQALLRAERILSGKEKLNGGSPPSDEDVAERLPF